MVKQIILVTLLLASGCTFPHIPLVVLWPLWKWMMEKPALINFGPTPAMCTGALIRLTWSLLERVPMVVP